jgi:hypothetical protein
VSNTIQADDALQEVASALTRNFDTNADGIISTGEFLTFLTRLTAAMNLSTGSTTSALTTSQTGASTTSQETREKVGTMAGFDQGKLADLGHTSIKYQVGRILQCYPNTPAGLRAALPEIREIAPNATISGSSGDKIDFGDYVDPKGNKIGVIDVILSASSGGKAWQWEPVS